jgi:hypothetical protein
MSRYGGGGSFVLLDINHGELDFFFNKKIKHGGICNMFFDINNIKCKS